MHFGVESVEFEVWGAGPGVNDHDAEFRGGELTAGLGLGRDEVGWRVQETG